MTFNRIAWAAYFLFVAAMLAINWQPNTLSFGGELGVVKLLVWVAYIAFLGYSLYCSTQENIIKTIKVMNQYHWGRQIGTDLYLGLCVAMIIVYLNEGIVGVAIWAIPTLVFANLSILLYIGLHFDTLVGRFLG